MKQIILWFLLATPTQQCLDRVSHENVGPCHEEQVSYTRDEAKFGHKGHWCPHGDYIEPCRVGELPKKAIQVCDPVPHPQPVPKQHFTWTLDPGELRSDDCYEVLGSSWPLTLGDPITKLAWGGVMTDVSSATASITYGEGRGVRK